MTFHDVRFPTSISRGSTGGPERRTDVVVLGSGHEERNGRWADSRRSWNAGYGVRSLDDISTIVSFFEERRGRLHAFRWRDPADWKSCIPSAGPSATDQLIAIGDGATDTFALVKTYGTGATLWSRTITKPVPGNVRVAIDGAEQTEGVAFTVDYLSGLVTFEAGHVPAVGEIITAGFAFDVPVRFDTDRLELSLTGFSAGAIPSIPILEVRA